MPQTLHCPKCSKTVSIGDQSAGKRVNCPHCSKTFLAPGFAPSSNDDDDWLELDNDPPKAAVISPPLEPAPAIQPRPADIAPSISSTKDESAPRNRIASEEKSNKKTAPGKRSPAKPSSTKSDSRRTESKKAVVQTTSSGSPSAGSLPPSSRSPGNTNSPRTDLPDENSPPLDDDPLAGFGSGLDDFTAGVEPLPSSEPTDDLFGDLPPVDIVAAPLSPAAVSSGPSKPTALDPFDDDVLDDVAELADATDHAPKATLAEYATEYRVRCKVCGSLLYAKAEQEGKMIKCGDCFSKVKVPPPPKIKQKVSIDVENAKTFSFEDAPTKVRRPDPYRKSAEELLDEAARVEKTETVKDLDTPDMREWMRNVFGIFLDPGVLFRWIGLSMLGAVPAAVVLMLESNILIIGLFIGGFLLAGLTVACGFAIMQSVANRHDHVSDWPEADVTVWMDDLVLALAAAGLAGGPIWLLCSLAIGPSLLSAAVTMLAVFALFPFFILSMMDMQSVLTPFSPEVARSASRCQEAWGGMYFSSGLLFTGLFLLYTGLSGANPAAAAVIGTIATIGVAFSYFAMIGRLAYAIGQPVNEPAVKAAESADAESQPS